MLLALLQAAARPSGGVTRAFRHMGALGLFLLAIIDSSPIPGFGGPDILTAVLAASHRHPWYEYACVATLGSVIGASITYVLARRVGPTYMRTKFGHKRVASLLELFEKHQTAALATSTAAPLPMPTSVFFAAAGASDYPSHRYIGVVAVCRGARYSAIALVADYLGRRFIHVLRHPGQYWAWLVLAGAVLAAVLGAAYLIRVRLERMLEHTREREYSV